MASTSPPTLRRKASSASHVVPHSPRKAPADPPVLPRRRDPWLTSTERDVLVLSTVLKVLLFPAYFSTDFEVHRNWLAITHSLPISKWYLDMTSEWTLDYPPFFAYFEYLLSLPASLVDPRIVDLQNLNYSAWSCIAFQRTTVIVTELVMVAALLRFVRMAEDPTLQRIVSLSTFLHPGFIIVDHIHFQYNGFLFGILLWSILSAKTHDLLRSGFLFAVLLNFKHIYMYIAPAYFVYLLRAYCFTRSGRFRFDQLVKLGTVVVATFAASFGPFALMGQIPQVLSRLFPFTRGLNHAYWAANAWALVTALDRVLLKVSGMRGIDIPVDTSGIESTSRGLVGDTHFAVIPNIKPMHTFAITIAFQLVFLTKLWLKPDYKSFVHALTLCGYTSFMFGWHVHEKAVLLILVPLSLLAAEDHAHFRTFVLASSAGICALFPLLFTPAEWFVKVAYSALWAAVVFPALGRRVSRPVPSFIGELLHRLETLYLWLLPVLQALTSLFTAVLALQTRKTSSQPQPSLTASLSQLEFLPLLLTSVYCAIGMSWAFVRLSWLYLKS